MIQTPGQKALRRNEFDCFWRWSDQEGILPQACWDKIPMERLTDLARNNMRFAITSPAAAIGRLAYGDFSAFALEKRADGLYVRYTPHDSMNGSIKRHHIFMELRWIGILFSPELIELKKRLPDATDREGCLAAYGFQKVLWRDQYAVYGHGIYSVTLNDRGIAYNF